MDQDLYRLLGPSARRCLPAASPARRRPPRPYSDVTRAVLARITSARVVLMAAPSGYGKTTLARQFTEAVDAPCCWFRCDAAEETAADAAVGILAAMAETWPEVVGEQAAVSGLAAAHALAHLTYVLDEVDGQGVVVVDDVHRLPPAEGRLLVETMLRHLPADMRLVVASRHDLGLDILEGIAEGACISLDATHLRFGPDEVAVLAGDGNRASILTQRTGGWPLAVGILKDSDDLHDVRDAAQLCGRAISSFGAGELELLRAVSPLRSVPTGVLAAVAPAATARLAEHARTHPSLLSIDDGRLTVGDLVAEGLLPPDRSVPVALLREFIAEGLGDHEPEAAFALHVATKDWASASRSLTRCLPTMADTGRWQALDEMAAELPAEHVDPMVRLRLVSARVWSGKAAVEALDAIAEEHADRPAVRIGAAAAAAHMRLYNGDPTALARTVGPLTELTAGDLTPAGVECVLRTNEAEMLEGTCGLVFALATCLLFTARGEDRVSARRYVEVAEAALDREGLDSALPVAIHRYIDASSGGLEPDLAVASIEKALIRIGDSLPAQRAVLLVLMAELEILIRGVDFARATVVEASELAEAYGFAEAALGAARILAETDAMVSGSTRAAEELWPAVCGAARGGAEFALRLGTALLDGGDVSAATRWLARSRTVAPAHPYSHWWQAALDARLRLLGGDAAAAEDWKSTLIRMRDAGVGRLGLGDTSAVRAEPDEHPPPPVPQAEMQIRVLAPTVRVERGDVTTEMRGIGARLLAILVANDGICELDRVVEYLWPEVAPDTGRNRFYVQLHRLRRTLGLGADGPLRCEDGLVRLDAGADTVRVDAWDFLAEAGGGELTPTVLDLYRDDFCARQFAYDDVAIAYRGALRRKFVQLVLRGGATLGTLDGPGAVAASVWERISDDADVALMVCGVLLDNGEPAAAEQVAVSTAAALSARGLDETEFLRLWADLRQARGSATAAISNTTHAPQRSQSTSLP